MDDKLKVFWNLDVLVKMCRSKSDGPSLRIEEEEIVEKIEACNLEIEEIKSPQPCFFTPMIISGTFIKKTIVPIGNTGTNRLITWARPVKPPIARLFGWKKT